MSKGQKRLASIQVIRAIAFIFIFLSHVELIPTGGIGVSLFLVLSGFCMTFSYLDKTEKTPVPCIMNNMRYNRRLQQWLGERADQQFLHQVDLPDGAGSVPVPDWNYNIVFQMAHMMHHYFDEGIGLRQMMDYYYLLQQAGKDLRIEKLKDLSTTLQYLNLYHFAGAVMYVLREVFGMTDEWMIVPVDERRGKTLMAEILHGGNFGQHSGLTKHGTVTKYLLKNWRSLRLVMEYPAEALSEPLFRTWHFFWRAKNK